MRRREFITLLGSAAYLVRFCSGSSAGLAPFKDAVDVPCRLAELFPGSFERFVGNREHARRNGEAERIAIDHHRRPVMWNRNLNLPSC
jgi:hypothetical protein